MASSVPWPYKVSDSFLDLLDRRNRERRLAYAALHGYTDAVGLESVGGHFSLLVKLGHSGNLRTSMGYCSQVVVVERAVAACDERTRI